jgi:tripartite-type tricarboxylate transporter receptor subunit TctC
MARLAAAFVLLASLAGAAQAQTDASWPNRQIRMVVPLPAGASVDVIGRLVAAKLGDRLGQTVVIENRAGASGAIGADAVAKASPDGYTLGMATTTTHVTNALVNSKLSYDPVKDFTPIAMIGVVPYALSVSPKLPVKDVRELIALAKSRHGALSYSSVGLGSVAHLATELLSSMTGIKLNHVPYRAASQAVIDLAEGRIDITFGTLGSSLPLIKDGKIKILAVSTSRRASQVPDIPTLVEAGVPGFETSLWFALVGPPNLPGAITARLNKEVNAIITDASVMKGFDLQAMQADPIPLERMGSVISDDLTRWRTIAAKAGVTAE